MVPDCQWQHQILHGRARAKVKMVDIYNLGNTEHVFLANRVENCNWQSGRYLSICITIECRDDLSSLVRKNSCEEHRTFKICLSRSSRLKVRPDRTTSRQCGVVGCHFFQNSSASANSGVAQANEDKKPLRYYACTEYAFRNCALREWRHPAAIELARLGHPMKLQFRKRIMNRG